MSEDTQNSIWSALFIVTLMALGALSWAILKRVKGAVSRALKTVQEKSARQEKTPAK